MGKCYNGCIQYKYVYLPNDKYGYMGKYAHLMY